jgi:hypothetical protein
MIKIAYYRGQTELGPTVVPLFGPADSTFEKIAAPTLLPEVARYIGALRPENDAQYVLLNALGAGEFWGSNINGDYFPEVALIHRPDAWTGNPLVDRIKARDWPYGFPTFYGAKPFLHHRNKDFAPHNHPSFGVVELAAWNDKMKRVELITRIDKELCSRFGGIGLWDKLRAGMFPDVSMGCKVPFDTCSICLDWEKYRKAQAKFDPKKHATPGQAVLEVFRSTQHRVKKTNDKGEEEWSWEGPGAIRGVSITRKDYCEHAKNHMNQIRSDGRKVFVYNDYPRFFDISFVFVGADKTAKVMMKVASEGKSYWFMGGAELAEKLGYDEDSRILQQAFLPELVEEKVASVPEEALKLAFLGKRAALAKAGEITKDVVPSQFVGKAVPVLTKSEPDMPHDVLDALGASPLEDALSTTAALGMVLRPREFQRIMLIQIGKRDLADDYDRKKVVFPKSDEKEEVPMGPSFFSPVLAKVLCSLMGARSAFGPSIEKRVLITPEKTEESEKRATSHSSALLRKMGAAYNGYRQNVMELVANTQDLISSAGLPPNGDLLKLASAPVEEVFTPLSFAYLQSAFMDEVGVEEKTSGVEGAPLPKNTWAQSRSAGGRTS